MRLIKMQYLQAVPARITRPLPTPRPILPFPPLSPPRTARSIFTSAVVPTANGEIMIKPASFQWNDGNYRVGCSRLPVFVHYSEAAYLARRRKVRRADDLIVHIPSPLHPSTPPPRSVGLYAIVSTTNFPRGRGGNVNIAYK